MVQLRPKSRSALAHQTGMIVDTAKLGVIRRPIQQSRAKLEHVGILFDPLRWGDNLRVRDQRTEEAR
eukprot:CAMPEP_0205904746 /NCGR_PEP_ID=MMETSP1325-20131115/915_1 /ASSEMBLY_ACC=CAM_ASM_000708 /TAXON_ID=236786 /ORGANISM="Florenciella sp., Strain RCC1007" /LENGTH=66 /DNA_ID=CAMNT_0053270567 /DNA_START=67 /DNA_END=264 /DNA_ORIENTATION=-